MNTIKVIESILYGHLDVELNGYKLIQQGNFVVWTKYSELKKLNFYGLLKLVKGEAGLMARVGWSEDKEFLLEDVSDLRAFDLKGAALGMRQNFVSPFFIAGEGDELLMFRGALSIGEVSVEAREEDCRNAVIRVLKVFNSYCEPYFESVNLKGSAL